MTKMTKIERIEVPVPFPPRIANCYFIPDSTPTLIDTGVNTPEALQCLQDKLREFGASISDIGRIILTHGHSDHAGAAGAVAAVSKASIFVHFHDKRNALSGVAEVSRENETIFRKFFQEAGVPAELAEKNTNAVLNHYRKYFSPISNLELLNGGELFLFDLFKLSVIHTPGHTAGSIGLFDEADGLLISGDSLIQGIIPTISAYFDELEDLPPYYGLEQYEKSISGLADLPIKTVLPGHGEPFSGHLQLIHRIKRYRATRRKRIMQILGSCQQGSKVIGMTPFEIVHKLFSKKSISKGIFMAVSEVRNCLETMEKEGCIALVDAGKKLLYRLN